MAVYALAGLPVLQRIVEGLWLQCGPQMPTPPADAPCAPRRQAPHPHHAVLRALRKRDAELARRGIHDAIARATAPVLARLRECERAVAPTRAKVALEAPLEATVRRGAGQAGRERHDSLTV
jgi:DNA-binding GntR family transcriptional regulator